MSGKGGKMSIMPDAARSNVERADFIGMDRLLSDGEREVRDRARAFVDEKVIPMAADH
jgi:hypothetical protein